MGPAVGWSDWNHDGAEAPTHRIISGRAFHVLPHNDLTASLDHVCRFTRPGIVARLSQGCHRADSGSQVWSP